MNLEVVQVEAEHGEHGDHRGAATAEDEHVSVERGEQLAGHAANYFGEK